MIKLEGVRIFFRRISRLKRVVPTIVFLGVVQRSDADSLANFTKCISPQGQSSVCQLDAGVYDLSSTLVIVRSNITVKWTITSSLGDTTLRRSAGLASGPLLKSAWNLTSI